LEAFYVNLGRVRGGRGGADATGLGLAQIFTKKKASYLEFFPLTSVKGLKLKLLNAFKAMIYSALPIFILKRV
jgi:hypothetical protein